MKILLVGPPGTGKTYTARRVAVETFGQEVVEVVDGGNESAWKALFPYKTPDGRIELGSALRASGYQMKEGKLVKAQSGGALIIDEVNRVPPELKTQFQLLASELVVPWPDGGTIQLDVSIVATANDSDLGVEEASRAELDRYDLVVRLSPTPDEQAAIVAQQAGVTAQVAQATYEAVSDLAKKLDPKKVHLPEGLRLAISIAKVLRTGTLGPADVFRGAAEKCWPLGRRGAEKHRAEFDSVVADVAGRFASKIANLGDVSAKQQPTATQSQPQGEQGPATLQDLLASLSDSTLTQISTKGALLLPRRFALLMHVFTTCFGMGVAKYCMTQFMAKKEVAERTGVRVRFGKDGKDAVEFVNADRHRVERFCRMCSQI
jgi:Mg-chelatase subunit ChlI